jgi:hypothetical protein
VGQKESKVVEEVVGRGGRGGGGRGGDDAAGPAVLAASEHGGSVF